MGAAVSLSLCIEGETGRLHAGPPQDNLGQGGPSTASLPVQTKVPARARSALLRARSALRHQLFGETLQPKSTMLQLCDERLYCPANLTGASWHLARPKCCAVDA